MNGQENKPVSKDAIDWTIDFLKCCTSKLNKNNDYAYIKNKMNELSPELESEVLRYIEGFKQYASGWSDKGSGKERMLKNTSLYQEFIQNYKD